MGFLLTIHTVVCVLLIIAILLQVGRGASTGAAFLQEQLLEEAFGLFLVLRELLPFWGKPS